jgi:hypothetical protein
MPTLPPSFSTWLNSFNISPPILPSHIVDIEPEAINPTDSHLGWREWFWLPEQKLLQSPIMGTLWHDKELRAHCWVESDMVRGTAGIHAHRMIPGWIAAYSEVLGSQSLNKIQNITLALGGGSFQVPSGTTIVWQGKNGNILGITAGSPDNPYTININVPRHNGGIPEHIIEELWVIRGIVERFGRYVLGTEGWRAEMAMIKQLLAPDDEIGLELERAYPDVEVIYDMPQSVPTSAAKDK